MSTSRRSGGLRYPRFEAEQVDPALAATLEEHRVAARIEPDVHHGESRSYLHLPDILPSRKLLRQQSRFHWLRFDRCSDELIPLGLLELLRATRDRIRRIGPDEHPRHQIKWRWF